MLIPAVGGPIEVSELFAIHALDDAKRMRELLIERDERRLWLMRTCMHLEIKIPDSEEGQSAKEQWAAVWTAFETGLGELHERANQ